ncbi:hypothetical protein VIGAN_05037600, partial [Vigna angularis var. angularis]
VQNKQSVVIVRTGSKFPKIEQTRGFHRMISTIQCRYCCFPCYLFWSNTYFRLQLHIVTYNHRLIRINNGPWAWKWSRRGTHY